MTFVDSNVFVYVIDKNAVAPSRVEAARVPLPRKRLNDSQRRKPMARTKGAAAMPRPLFFGEGRAPA